MAIKLKVTQIRSGIGGTERQRLTLKGLGLTRMGRSVVLVDNLAVRGMIRKVAHLVEVEPAE
jgi:large subunit ribosomal protein L30